MRTLLEGMLKDIGGSDLFDSIISILTKDPLADYGVEGVITNLYEMILTVATMLMFIYFLIAVVDKMTSENFTWEQFWKQMAMLLAAKVVMEHGLQIMSLMSQVGVALVDMINGQGDASLSAGWTDSTIATIIDGFEDEYSFAGFFKIMGDIILFAYLIFPWIFSWIMRIAVNIICYTRLIEIYVRAGFAPIALSDFFKNGFQGSGWRFLKDFFAVCLQGAIILGIAIMFSALLKTLIGDPGSIDFDNWFVFLGKYFAVGCSAIMLMFRSLSLSKEIMGSR